MEPQKVNLGNICGGAAQEVFDRELAAVLENIADPNTDAEAVRGLTLEFKFAPNSKRSVVAIAYQVKKKLALIKTEASSAFVAMGAGELGLYSMDVNQGILPLETVSKSPTMEEIKPIGAPAPKKAAPPPNAN